MKIYTRKGDDGTTGLFRGGRVTKDSPRPSAYGAVDEAQAVIGMARSETERGSALDDVLVTVERDLYVLMAELATDEAQQTKLVDGESRVTAAMVEALERRIDEATDRFEPPTEFVLPGENRVAAALDLARTVVRRAERDVVGVPAPGSQVMPYLNRLSDLLWALARWQEGEHVISKEQ
jgi:cob(I)alamin adenosyltransferase